MTGRELIVYILENNLENEDIFKDGKIVGLMTIHEAAAKMNVGGRTVHMWADMDWIEHVKINNIYYIPVNAERPNVNGKDL